MDIIATSLTTILSLDHLMYLTFGVVLGIIVGILPGLGGVAGLSVLLPFTYGVEPSSALAMMIGLLIPTTTSDTFTSVLLGIPGTSASQATVLDGFPLAKQGQAARALSAAFTSSLLGGVFGAAILTVAIGFSRPVIMAFGFGEQLMLVIFALTMVAMLTGKAPLKGIAACSLGLLLGSIGAAPATGEYRMTFGTLYLSDGLSIMVVGLAMFAVPEIIDLLRREEPVAGDMNIKNGWLTGVKDVVRNKWLVLRSATLGCLLGALPGIGGSANDWIVYGHVVQTSRDRSKFGKGDIRGVIAVESSNNAKDGGALVPTLLFGIPGTGSMAIILGGFVLVGLQPGPQMLTQHMDITLTIIWSVALANIIGAGICFLLAPQFARITTVKFTLVGPVMIVLIFFAAFQVSRSLDDMIALLLAGAFGVYMKRFGWPRPALLVGFVLSPGLEASLYQAMQVYGLSFFQRPLVLAILAVTIISVLLSIRSHGTGVDSEQVVGVDAEGDAPTRRIGRLPQIVFSVFMLVVAIVAIAQSVDGAFLSKLFPVTVASILTLACLGILFFQGFGKEQGANLFDAADLVERRNGVGYYLLWILGYILAVWLVGMQIAAMGFVLALVTIKAGWRSVRNLGLAIGVLVAVNLASRYLNLVFPDSVLDRFIDMPDWLAAII